MRYFKPAFSVKKNIICRKGGERVVDMQTALCTGQSEVRLSAGTRYVYFLRNFHTGVGPAHPPTQWVKRQRREAYNSSSTTAEAKNEWSCTSVPPVCLHGLERNTCASYAV